MFESFKPRKEEIVVEDFENWKITNPELQRLAIAVGSKMKWETEDVNGEHVAISFTPDEGYTEALRDLKRHLDKLGHTYTDKAIAVVLARILDVGEYGYDETID